MKTRKLAAWLLAGAVIAVVPTLAVSQGSPSSRSAYKAPRTAWGAPELTGVWTNATITPVARPASVGGRQVHTPEEVARLEGASLAQVEAGNRPTDPTATTADTCANPPCGYNRGWLDPGTTIMRVAGQPRTGFLTTPDGQFPQARQGAAAGAGFAGRAGAGAPGAQAGRGPGGAAAAGRGGGRGGQFDNPEQRPLGERCIISFGRNAGPPMLPNGFYNNNYQFTQTKDTVAIVVEMVHDVRLVRIGGKHRTDGVRPWMGDSIGRWEGETLVVETTNLPQRQAYRGSWENLKVVEKFTRVGPDRMLYQFEIHDPTMWDKPWGGEYEFGALNGSVHEYACHEGNYALEGILAGARSDEALARTASAAGAP